MALQVSCVCVTQTTVFAGFLLSTDTLTRSAGQPVMRPLWFEFPDAPSLFAVDDEFMLGPALLVAPVLDEGVESRAVTLPAGPVWYDAATGVRCLPLL